MAGGNKSTGAGSGKRETQRREAGAGSGGRKNGRREGGRREARQGGGGRGSEKIVRRPEYATVERTILERNAELIERFGAHHIGVSKKIRSGEKLPDTCITVYVLRKGPAAPGREVPAHLALSYASGTALVATDVCEIGEEPRGFKMRGGNLVVAGDGETGTVGLVFGGGGGDFFLTNAHVATDPGQRPGKVRVSAPGGEAFVGTVTRMDDLTASVISSDAALVRVPSGSVASGEFYGVEVRLRSCGEIARNDPRRFFYVAEEFVHELRWRAYVPAASPILIDGYRLLYAGFHVLDLSAGQCRPGHSGAVIFCQSAGGLQAVALLFGGIQSINQVWAFPVRLSLRQMGVDPDRL